MFMAAIFGAIPFTDAMIVAVVSLVIVSQLPATPSPKRKVPEAVPPVKAA
jgi:hypothetical protein